jgi:hypothetical protein
MKFAWCLVCLEIAIALLSLVACRCRRLLPVLRYILSLFEGRDSLCDCRIVG